MPAANFGPYRVRKWFTFVEDAQTNESGQPDGDPVRKIVAAAADDVPIQGYGKACLVGVLGEYEHGNAFLTQVFADPVRDAVGGGKAWVPSTGKVAGPGAVIDIPLAHKDALFVRSHYDTVSVSFGDAPRGDEVIVAFAFATRGRLRARLGGLAAHDITGSDGLR